MTSEAGRSVPGRLDALPHEERVDRILVDAKDAPDPDGVEPAAVDQPADRLRVDTELNSDLADAV